MLKLSAAHLKEQRKQDPSKRLIWLDIGGGTGTFRPQLNLVYKC
jgi:betaine lipid synthase